MTYEIAIVRSNRDDPNEPRSISILLNSSEVTRIPEQDVWTNADVAHQVWIGIQATIDRLQADRDREVLQ